MKRLHIAKPAIQSQKKSDIQRGDKPTAFLSLEEVRTRFEIWSRAKKPHNRIPRSLWAAAVNMCMPQSVYRVFQALR
jgi:hypothetical protein